jgi:hypothetical protein
MIWGADSNVPGLRVSIVATSLDEARSKLDHGARPTRFLAAESPEEC